MSKKPPLKRALKLEFVAHTHHIDLYIKRLSNDAKIASALHKCHIATHRTRAYKSYLV